MTSTFSKETVNASHLNSFNTYGSKVLPLYLTDTAAVLLDQTQLPTTQKNVETFTVVEMAKAIETMIVRGAPAIGIAAAYGLVLSIRQFIQTGNSTTEDYKKQFQTDKKRLLNTRPTAVNLSWALNEMENTLHSQDFASLETIKEAFTKKALQIHQEDIDACKTMGDFGAELMPAGATILTHCNAGALATGGYGTALGVIRSAYAKDATIQVIADETRPRFQGARLTTWELVQDAIPVTLISDNMSASLMAAGKINAVVVGADRITANGDVANKIGTYGVAVLAKAHNIPFYVAAPKSTFDLSLQSGADIPIEYRNDDEINVINCEAIAAQGSQFFNPGFDVTPAHLVSAIITEHGIIQSPDSDKILQIIN